MLKSFNNFPFQTRFSLQLRLLSRQLQPLEPAQTPLFKRFACCNTSSLSSDPFHLLIKHLITFFMTGRKFVQRNFQDEWHIHRWAASDCLELREPVLQRQSTFREKIHFGEVKKKRQTLRKNWIREKKGQSQETRVCG